MSTLVVATIVIAGIWLITGSLAWFTFRRLRAARRRIDHGEQLPSRDEAR